MEILQKNVVVIRYEPELVVWGLKETDEKLVNHLIPNIFHEILVDWVLHQRENFFLDLFCVP
jgi:hypothetical protein